MIFKLVLACIGIFLGSYFVGLNFLSEKTSVVKSVVYGFLTILGGTEVVALLSIYFQLSFHVFFYVLLICIVLAAVCGIIRQIKRTGNQVQMVQRIPRNVFFVLFVFILLGQIGVWQIAYHTDEDDSFYVATATTTIDTDSMFKVDAYTGDEYEQYPARYVLSPFPVFVAFISKAFGIRPVVVSHTLFPIVVIFLSYGVLWMLAEIFFKEDREKSMVLFLASVITTFSYFSTRIVSARLLLRPWQGKTLLASIVLPAILYFLLKEGAKKEMKILQWVNLFFLMLSACLVSSMGIALSVVLLGCVVLAQLIVKKNWKYTLQTICCCIPAGVLSLIYIMIR